MERPIEMSEDELRAALRAAFHMDDGPPPGVRCWTVRELAEMLNLTRPQAADRAQLALEEGTMKRAKRSKGYVYWFTNEAT